MIRFCFPNIIENDFVGLGVFFVGSPDDISVLDEELADPNTSDIDNICLAIKSIAPEAFDSKNKVYQHNSYIGDSMGFAFFLAWINCSRKIFFDNDSSEINIWCTGSIKPPSLLSSVFRNGFDLKLEAFISESEDKLFLVPFANINPIHTKMLNEHKVRHMSLNEFSLLSKKDILKQKTIVKIHKDELQSLVNFLFVKPLQIKLFVDWVIKSKKIVIYMMLISFFVTTILINKYSFFFNLDFFHLFNSQTISQEQYLTSIQAGIHLLFIQGGCYDLNNKISINDKQLDNSKAQICIDSFWIGQSEITQGQWKRVMGKNPSFFKDCGHNCPVENISWEDADRFIKILNTKHSKGEFRLISEAQWEYVCRKNIKEEFFEEDISVNSTYPIDPLAYKSKKLIGFSGNVLEWCEDSFITFPYRKNVFQNPRYLFESPAKVVRGISWSTPQMYAICTHRFKYLRTDRYSDLGLRIVWYQNGNK